MSMRGLPRWILFACLLEPAHGQPYQARIVVDQVGYLPDWPKVALLIAPGASSPGMAAQLLEAGSGNVALTLTVGAASWDSQSGDLIHPLDFSTFTRPGRYVLQAGDAESPEFAIGEDIFIQPLRMLLRSFYLQRCGIEIADPVTGIHHGACHTADGLLAHTDWQHRQGDRIRATGGWHDAGDYGKYVATTAVAVARLLDVYERFPSSFDDSALRIPESGNGIPDVLDEARIGLDWMLSMQRADGAIYRKVGGAAWPGPVIPEADNQPRFVYGVSTPETAKAAATWAMAARLYKTFAPAQAERYRTAALRAWHFLQLTPAQQFDFQAGDDSGSGPYRSNATDTEPSLLYDWDDRLWAAVELSTTTGKPDWNAFIAAHLPNAPIHIYEWKDPSSLALVQYALRPDVRAQPSLRNEVVADLLSHAAELITRVGASPYRLANQRFVWGSNKMTVEEGILLLDAFGITRDARYRDAALDQLHYIFGRNHFGQSWVSGIGAHPVLHVSHMFARAAGITIPGLFVGGPNELEQSGIAPRGAGQRSYADDDRSYATNEYAIDYDASLISLIVSVTASPEEIRR